MADERTPNQGATGEAAESVGAERAGSPPPAAAEASQGEGAVNQGAQGDAPTQAQGADAGQSPLEAQRAAAPGLLDERPEILVGGAFAAGFVLAKLLARLGRG